MTNDDLVRLDQRVITLEGTTSLLQQRVNVLESQLAAANMKLETLNSFYITVLGETTTRLLGIFDKAANAVNPTP